MANKIIIFNMFGYIIVCQCKINNTSSGLNVGYQSQESLKYQFTMTIYVMGISPIKVIYLSLNLK